MSASNPTIVIINGLNWFGIEIAKKIITQKGKVIILDHLIEANKKYIELIKSDANLVSFYEINKVDFGKLANEVHEIKYGIVIDNLRSPSGTKFLSSRQFIDETALLDKILNFFLSKKTRVVYLSSLDLFQLDYLYKGNTKSDNEEIGSTNLDIQKFKEKTVLEFAVKAGLKADVARLGILYSENQDFSNNKLILNKFLKDIVTKNHVYISGDGLNKHYFIYSDDAISGIFKILFLSRKDFGKILYLADFKEVSELNLANTIIEIENREVQLRFKKSKFELDPLIQSTFSVENNISEFGWSPKINLTHGLKKVHSAYLKYVKTNPRFNKARIELLKEAKDSLHYNMSFFNNQISQSEVQKEKNEKYTKKYAKNYFVEYRNSFYILIVGLFIILLFLVPLFQITRGYFTLRSNSFILSSSISRVNTNIPLDSNNILDEVENVDINLIELEKQVSYTINLLKVIGLANEISEYQTLMSGLSDFSLLLELYKNDNIGRFFIDENLNIEDYENISTLRVLVSSSKSNLEVYKKVYLDSVLVSNIVLILDWLNNFENLIET